MNALVRPARMTDAAEIARLATELGYPTSDVEMEERLAVLLRSASYFIAVAGEMPRLTGWVAAERRLLLESGERAELVGLIVSAEARRHGIGKTLVQAAEQWARHQGLGLIAVRSSVTRAESHPFYEGLGYIRRKTQHAYTKALPPG